jgi:hypothetical protein
MPARTSRLAWVLLALTTLVAFGGPVLIWLVFRGGEHTAWPPESQEEWLVLGLVVGGFAALMVASIGVAAFQYRKLRRATSPRLGGEDLHLTDAETPPSELGGPNDLRL